MSAQLSDHLDGMAPAIEAMLMQVTAGRDALPPGTRLGDYIVEQVLGRNDIAVAYVAQHAATGKQVEIEEYLPEAIARREDDDLVHPRSPALAAAFETGRRAFIDEARHLSQALHPALLRVLATWQGNGTAYRALPLLPDTTLDQLRPALSDAPPSEPWLRALLLPLAGAVGALHAVSLVHGNLRPGSILLRADGAPLLLGFDSARWALADLATHPEPGFLAIEQTERYGALPIGPWTDLYALGAVALYAVCGHAPSAAAQRIGAGTATPFADTIAEVQQRFPTLAFAPTLAAALDHALKLAPGQRPHSVGEWLAAFGAPAAAAQRAGDDASALPAAAPVMPDIVLDDLPPVSRREAAATAATHVPRPAAAAAPPVADTTAEAPRFTRTATAVPPSGAAATAATPFAAAAAAASFAEAAPGARVAAAAAAASSLAADTAPAAPFPASTAAAPSVATASTAARPISATQRGGEPTLSDDGGWRAIRSNEQAAKPLPRRAARGWWLAAALPAIGIAVLGWHWQQVREVDSMLDAFRDSMVRRDAGPAPAAIAVAPPPATTALPPAAIETAPSTVPAPLPSAPTDVPPARVVAPTATVPEPAPPLTVAQPRTAAPTPPPVAPAPTARTASPTSPTPAAAQRPRATPPPRPATVERARPSDVRSAAAADARRRAAAPAVAAEPDNPRAGCGPRTNFSLYRCMQTQCERDRYYTHAQCVRLRQRDEVS